MRMRVPDTGLSVCRLAWGAAGGRMPVSAVSTGGEVDSIVVELRP